MIQKSRQELLIERNTEELEEVRRSIFVTSPGENGGFRAIIGAHCAGKTTLRNMWYDIWKEEMKKNQRNGVYYVSVNVAVYRTSLAIWKAVVSGLSDQLEDQLEDQIDKKITDNMERIEAAGKQTSNEDVSRWVVNLFKRCKAVGIHVILVLDEVNCILSSNYDKEDKRNFFDILRALENDSNTCGISILLLSQIGIGDMVADLENREQLRAFIHKYPQIRLKGFNYLDLSKLFFKIRNQGQSLSQETIGRILYYCGRFPGMLGVMGQTSFEDSVWGIDRCYENSKGRINEIYDWFADRLEEVKFLSSDGEISGINVFLQTFAGPDFDTEFELSEWLEVLYEKGLVERPAMKFKKATEQEQPCHINDHIAELLRITEPEQKVEGSFNEPCSKKLGYEPISPYFVEYLQRKRDREEDEAIRELRIMIRNVEKTIRKLIYEAYVKEDEATYGIVVHKTEKQKKEQWERINKALLFAIGYANNGGTRNAQKIEYWEGNNGIKGKAEQRARYDISPVDVLAFNNYYQLITWTDYRETSKRAKCWEAVRGYLNCYQRKDDATKYDGIILKQDFEFLNEARNFFAHENATIGFAEEENRQKLRDICIKITESVQKEEKRLKGGARWTQ